MNGTNEIVNALHAATCHPGSEPFWHLLHVAADHIESLQHQLDRANDLAATTA